MRRIVCVLFLVGVFSINPVCGETLSEYRENLYDLFIQQKIPQWGHEILCGYYGLVGHLVDKKKKDEAQAYLKTALALSENYRKMYPNDARFKALHANLIGLKIALSPMRAATLASGMLSSAKTSYKLAPGDSWVSILYGNILFYMPGIFGGDKEEGLECYQRARRSMEKDISTNGHHWLYVQLLVTIGVVYEKSEHYEQALAMYKTIMEKYPEYGFVKNTSYPRALKAMQQKQ